MLACGAKHTVLLRADGTCAATGDNEHGQCDVGSWREIDRIVCGGTMTVGIKRNGTVVSTKYGFQTGQWRNIETVACGTGHIVGLCADGTCVATGNNEDGQCDVSSWRDIVKVVCDGAETYGLKKDGTVAFCGWGRYKQSRVKKWKKIKDICCNGFVVAGLSTEGRAVACGGLDSMARALKQVKKQRNIRAVACSYNTVCFIKTDDSVEVCSAYPIGGAYDRNNVAELYSGTFIVCALKKDGTLTRLDKSDKEGTSAWKHVTSVAAGSEHIACITREGSVLACGLNDKGQCDVSGWSTLEKEVDGRIYEESCPAPVRKAVRETAEHRVTEAVASITPMIVSGLHHDAALLADGTVRAFGSNDCGQCNTSSWRNIIQISCGISHTVGLRADGTVVAAGQSDGRFGDYGQARLSDWRDVARIVCSSNTTFGITRDGRVLARGDCVNSDMQSVISGWLNIVDVGCLGDFVVALRSDGRICAVGGRYANESVIGVLGGWTDIKAISCSANRIAGLRADGTVVCVDNYGAKPCDTGVFYNIQQIVCGEFRVYGVNELGNVLYTGEYEPRLSALRNVSKISPLNETGLLCLCRDGTCVAVCGGRDGEGEVSGWKNVVDISGSVARSAAITSDGRIFHCGRDFSK